jgi:hypothetical protein
MTLDIDNAAERALRNPVIGRKNYYGSQAQWAAYLAATVWTITATVERSQREPLSYLNDYLQACALAGGNPSKAKSCNGSCPGSPSPATPAEAATTTRHHRPHPNRQPPSITHRKPIRHPAPHPTATTGRAPTMTSHGSTEPLHLDALQINLSADHRTSLEAESDSAPAMTPHSLFARFPDRPPYVRRNPL